MSARYRAGRLLDSYLRDVVSKRKQGPDAVYVQLVEDHRDPETGKVKTEILHSFSRKEKLDLDRIRRLVDQLLTYLTGRSPSSRAPG